MPPMETSQATNHKGRPRSLSESLHIFTTGFPAASSPSPTRVGKVSMSIPPVVTFASLSPSRSPSPSPCQSFSHPFLLSLPFYSAIWSNCLISWFYYFSDQVFYLFLWLILPLASNWPCLYCHRVRDRRLGASWQMMNLNCSGTSNTSLLLSTCTYITSLPLPLPLSLPLSLSFFSSEHYFIISACQL